MVAETAFGQLKMKTLAYLTLHCLRNIHSVFIRMRAHPAVQVTLTFVNPCKFIEQVSVYPASPAQIPYRYRGAMPVVKRSCDAKLNNAITYGHNTNSVTSIVTV